MRKQIALGSVLSFVALFVGIGSGIAQTTAATGTLSGTIREETDGSPIAGCEVRVVPVRDSTHPRVMYTTVRGAYRFSRLAVGTYLVSISSLGYATVSKQIDLSEGESASFDTTLATTVLSSDEVVVTASRVREKVTDAPASISIVGPRQIAATQAPTVTHLFTAVPGMDVNQEGVFAQSYASRAASSVYSSDLYTMIDNRSMSVPGIGGYFGILMPISNFDIDRIELVRGPGAALYGPGASEGVAQIITKSAFEAQGLQLSVAGGERDYANLQARYATSLSSNVAIKVSGTYRRVHDWEYVDTGEVHAQSLIEAAAQLAPSDTATFFDTVHVGHRLPDAAYYTVDGRIDYLFSDEGRLTLSAGRTDILQAIQMTTAAGAAQADGWTMDYTQARMTLGDLFAEAHFQKVNTSETYVLLTGEPISEASHAIEFQLQNHNDLGALERLTYGADFNSVTPVNSLTYGVNSGTVTSNIAGAYVQSRTLLLPDALDLTVAARLDKQSEITSLLFSPRAALVAHLGDDRNQTVRLMYNRTTTPPGVDAYYYDLDYSRNVFGVPLLPDQTRSIDLRIVGKSTSGLHFSSDGGWYQMYSPYASGEMSVRDAVNRAWSSLQALAIRGFGSLVTDTALVHAFAQIPAPSPDFVQGTMKMFDGVSSFRPVTSVDDLPAVEPQGHDVLELDYQVALGSKAQLEIDGYRSHYDHYAALQQPVTPNVFANAQELQSYYNTLFRIGAHLDSASAAKYSNMLVNGFTDSTGAHVSGLAELPIGTVTPDGSAHPGDLLYAVPAYYGDVNYYGLDFRGSMQVNDQLSVRGSFSYVSDNLFQPDDSTRAPIYLNIPKYKGSAGFHYASIVDGLDVDAQYRWYDGFPMRSGIQYVGDVAARGLVDVTLNYSTPAVPSLRFTLSVTDLLNHPHQDFIGAPYIGRFTTLTLTYGLGTD